MVMLLINGQCWVFLNTDFVWWDKSRFFWLDYTITHIHKRTFNHFLILEVTYLENCYWKQLVLRLCLPLLWVRSLKVKKRSWFSFVKKYNMARLWLDVFWSIKLKYSTTQDHSQSHSLTTYWCHLFSKRKNKSNKIFFLVTVRLWFESWGHHMIVVVVVAGFDLDGLIIASDLTFIIRMCFVVGAVWFARGFFEAQKVESDANQDQGD